MKSSQRGGGPQTAAGKINSSQNAVKHGITSNKMYVLQNENPAAWAELLDICVEQFRPTNRYERTIVEEIAFAKWRLRRMWTIETGLMDVEMDDQATAFAAKYATSDEGVRQTLAFKALADNSNASSLLNRYQVRLERSIDRAVKSLNDLRAAARADTQSSASELAAAPEKEAVTENAKRTPERAAAALPEEEVTFVILQNELGALPSQLPEPPETALRT
jgi:hypothetical protein